MKKKKRWAFISQENICICYVNEFQHAQSSCWCGRRSSGGSWFCPVKPFLHRRGTSKKRRLYRDRNTESARMCLKKIQIRQNSLFHVFIWEWRNGMANMANPVINQLKTFYLPSQVLRHILLTYVWAHFLIGKIYHVYVRQNLCRENIIIKRDKIKNWTGTERSHDVILKTLDK